jgi:hypothetical protein
MVEVIRYHHLLEEDEEAIADGRDTIAVVSVANLMANLLGFGTEAPSSIDLDTSIPARLLGLEPPKMLEFLEALKPEIEEQQSAFI